MVVGISVEVGATVVGAKLVGAEVAGLLVVLGGNLKKGGGGIAGIQLTPNP